jgi:outer membrane protein assembly factor BamB
MPRRLFLLVPVALAVTAAPGAIPTTPAAPVPREPGRTTWAMFGGTHGRNMVNRLDRDILDNFDLETGTGVLWKADLGSTNYSQPVVAGGRVYVGTNNGRPRNPRDTKKDAKSGEVEPIDRGILMCFDQKTGKFLWQAVHDKLPSGNVNDWSNVGIGSTPAVEENRVYYVSNRAEVVCVDANGFADGNQGFRREQYKDETDADVLWSFDMIGELKVFPHNLAACPPLVVGDIVFVVTANGVGETHIDIPAPDAPSFIALDKMTGKLLWKDSSPGKNIMHAQWGIPSYTAEPVPQVIFPGGDGWLRAFDPKTGKLLWKFDGNPKDAKYELGGTGTKSDFVNVAPVIAGGRVYIGLGQDPEHTTGPSRVWCIDLKRAVEFGAKNKDADVSPVDNNFDPMAAVNKNSALVWHFGGEDKRPGASRDFIFGRTMSCMCVVDDVVYAAELHGYIHCLDAKTGKRYWVYDTRGGIWGSPYFVDGKVYLATEAGDLFIFKHQAKPEAFPDPDDVRAAGLNRKAARQAVRDLQTEFESKLLVRKIELPASARATPAVAGGVLYLSTENTLYAITRR